MDNSTINSNPTTHRPLFAVLSHEIGSDIEHSDALPKQDSAVFKPQFREKCLTKLA